MKKRICVRAVSLLLCLLFALCLGACMTNDTDDFVGRWRMVSYVTDDGKEAVIENELDMIFYSTGIGEAQIDGKTQYMFDYSVGRGKLTRLITHSSTNVVEVHETYEFSEDRRMLTVYSPEDEATIVLEKIEDKVLNRIEINQ